MALRPALPLLLLALAALLSAQALGHVAEVEDSRSDLRAVFGVDGAGVSKGGPLFQRVLDLMRAAVGAPSDLALDTLRDGTAGYRGRAGYSDNFGAITSANDRAGVEPAKGEPGRTHPVEGMLATTGGSAGRRVLAEGVCDESLYDCKVANSILNLTNTFRAEEGKSWVCLSNKLNAAAKVHSEDMVANNFFNHRGSDGLRVNKRVDAAGFKWKAVGENIATRYEMPRGVMSAWEASSGHRKNLLGDYTHMGVYKAGSKWTQVFAKNSDELCDPYSKSPTPPATAPLPQEPDFGTLSPAEAPIEEYPGQSPGQGLLPGM